MLLGQIIKLFARLPSFPSNKAPLVAELCPEYSHFGSVAIKNLCQYIGLATNDIAIPVMKATLVERKLLYLPDIFSSFQLQHHNLLWHFALKFLLEYRTGS